MTLQSWSNDEFLSMLKEEELHTNEQGTTDHTEWLLIALGLFFGYSGKVNPMSANKSLACTVKPRNLPRQRNIDHIPHMHFRRPHALLLTGNGYIK